MEDFQLGNRPTGIFQVHARPLWPSFSVHCCFLLPSSRCCKSAKLCKAPCNELKRRDRKSSGCCSMSMEYQLFPADVCCAQCGREHTLHRHGQGVGGTLSSRPAAGSPMRIAAFQDARSGVRPDWLSISASSLASCDLEHEARAL